MNPYRESPNEPVPVTSRWLSIDRLCLFVLITLLGVESMRRRYDIEAEREMRDAQVTWIHAQLDRDRTHYLASLDSVSSQVAANDTQVWTRMDTLHDEVNSNTWRLDAIEMAPPALRPLWLDERCVTRGAVFNMDHAGLARFPCPGGVVASHQRPGVMVVAMTCTCPTGRQ